MTMKKFLIFLAFVGSALAGVGRLTPEQEDEILQQFANLCLSGNFPEHGQEINGIYTYCKRGPGIRTQQFETQANIRIPTTQSQSVLVQPPKQEYIHNLVVNANVDGGKSNVYVVPGDFENKYNVQVEPNTEKPDKPTVYFLRKQQRQPDEQVSGGYTSNPKQQDQLPVGGYASVEPQHAYNFDVELDAKIPASPAVHFLQNEEILGNSEQHPYEQVVREVNLASLKSLRRGQRSENTEVINEKPVIIIKKQDSVK